jgi:hypothetical protein
MTTRGKLMIKAFDRIRENFNKIGSDRIRDIGRMSERDFVRKRKMNFEDMTRIILNKRGKTTTMEINNYYKEINKRELRTSKQAFSKQRRKLNPKMFIQLNKEYVESIYKYAEIEKLKDYIVTAVDGSVFQLPNSKELYQEFGGQKSNKEGARFATRATASGIYDVKNNIMIDAIIDKYNTSERELAERNIENMYSILGKNQKIITIFDRGYVSVQMLLFLMDYPIFYLFRVQSNKFIAERKSMTTDDEMVELNLLGKRLQNISDVNIKKKAKELKSLSVRMVKITLETGEDEYLLTNIPFEDVNTEEMGRLYFERWGIEIAYDVIKNKLYIENISGKSKIIVEQDFYSHILVYNMVEDLKNGANSEIDKRKNPNLKYDYKVNINVLVGTFREYMIKVAIEEDLAKAERLHTWMFEEIMENLVPVRPNRKYLRKEYKGRNKYRDNNRRNS